MIRLSISGVADLPPLDGLAAVISIGDPGDGLPEALEGSGLLVLELAFHDADTDLNALDRLPESWHLEGVAQFLNELPLDAGALHVHCYAGVSRSTAVASFVLATLDPGLSDAQIVQQVLTARPQAVPNRLLLKHADALLDRHLHRVWVKQAGRY